MSMSSALRDALWNLKQSRKAKLTLLVILVLAVVLLAGYVLFAGGGARQKTVSENTNTPVTAQDERVRRALDGVLVPLDQANLYPTCAMIENLAEARPQAGLEKANLVYEALTEGGITRFLAVFTSSELAPKIGPIRSARDYYVDWVRELDCLYIRAGGSPQAAQAIAETNINDFNQFYNSQYFWRDEEREKKKFAREHTLYTSSELLVRASRDKQYPAAGTYDVWTFADDPPLAERPTGDIILTIPFSTFTYKVDYAYDRATNSYTRKQAEQPHVTEEGKVLTAKNVIVQYTETGLAEDKEKKGRLKMQTVGQGNAVIYHDGKEIKGTWKKPSREGRTRYYDVASKEIVFTAGSTWVEILPNDREVTYTATQNEATSSTPSGSAQDGVNAVTNTNATPRR